MMAIANLALFLATPLSVAGVVFRSQGEVAHVATNEAAGGTIAMSHRVAHNLSEQAPCYRHLKKNPSEITCPIVCPFLRAEPTRVCEFKCVEARDCSDDNPLANFANPETHLCEACLVPACKRCSKTSKHVCAQCHDSFELIGGVCLAVGRSWGHFFHGALVVILLIVLVWWVQLFRRKVSNFEVLKQAVDFRYSSSVRNQLTGSQWSLLTTDMRHETRVAGLGTIFHFRFMYAATILAFCIMIPLIVLSIVWAYRSSLEHVKSFESRQTFNACEEGVRESKTENAFMEGLYFSVLCGIYIVWTVGSIVYFRWSSQDWQTKHLINDAVGQYAMLAKGFPILSGSENVEKDFEEFLRTTPVLEGVEIVGVSVCWNYGRSKKAEIDAHIKFLVGEQEGRNTPEQLLASSRLYQEEYAKRSCCDTEFRFIDSLFGFANFSCGGPKEPEELPDIIEVLDSLETSRYAFIVFNTLQDSVKAKRATDKTPLEYKGSKIELFDHDYEPMTVVWEGWGCQKTERYLRLSFGWIAILVAVVILDVFFYFPYVQYIMSYNDVAGMTQGSFFTGTVLGLLITVCNQILYQLAMFFAQSCGWTNKGREMRYYVLQYTLAVLLNTIVDLWTVVILSRGYAIDEAIQYQKATDHAMSAKALAEQPSLQQALYVQLLSYIYPSCLLLPFLIEPLATTTFPYLLGTKLVGSHHECSIQQAEECLAMPDYDLSRYGDVIVNIMLCCLMFTFTYPQLWMIWFYFIISMIVIYTWDRVRLMRFSKRCNFTSMTMDAAAQYMATLPVGILAAALVFRMYGAKHDGFLAHLDSKELKAIDIGHIKEVFFQSLTRHTIVWACFGAFVCHVFIHSALLRAFSPRKSEESDDSLHTSIEELEEIAKQKTKTYPEVAKYFPDSFFTTNPVHCLRSKHKYTATDQPPCPFFEVGKPYLIEPSPKLGVYYNYEEVAVNIPDYETRHSSMEHVSSGMLERKFAEITKGMKTEAQTFLDGYGHTGFCAVTTSGTLRVDKGA